MTNLSRVRLLWSALILASTPALGAPSWFEGGVDGATLCFTRDYSDAELTAHPKQDTRSVRLLVKGATVRLTITGRRLDRATADAACDWSPRAGRDVSGRIIVKGHNGGPGYDCIVTGDAASATEEGSLLIVPSASDRRVLLYVQDDIGVRAEGAAGLVRRRAGPDDRVFRLGPASHEACEPYL